MLLETGRRQTRTRVWLTLGGGRLSVGEVAERVGCSVHVASNHLRALEADGLVRSEKVGRNVYYNMADPEAYHVLTEEMALMRQAGESQAQGVGLDVEAAQTQFAYHLMKLRADRAEALVIEWEKAGIAPSRIALDVYTPALAIIEHLLAQDYLSPVVMNFAGSVIMQLLAFNAFRRRFFEWRADAPTAAVGCAKGNMHVIGVYMVAQALHEDGWNVIYLDECVSPPGVQNIPRFEVMPDLPIAHLLCLSLSDEAEVPASILCLEECRLLTPQPLTLVGGPAVNANPALVRELRADGTAKDAREASLRARQLFETRIATQPGATLRLRSRVGNAANGAEKAPQEGS